MYGEHIRELCREHRILRVEAPGRGRASVNARRIQHPPLVDEMAYFVALHEVGHIVLGIPPLSSRLEREAWCWRYAYEQARVYPSYPTRQRVAACLLRYVARAKKHGWRIPDEGSDFWAVMAWWNPPDDQTA